MEFYAVGLEKKNGYSGVIERVGGRVSSGNTGRQVFASISVRDASFLKPGDFLNVKIFEPKLKDVAKLPLSALGSNNTILLVNDDLRLEKIKLDVLRFQENHVLATNLPFDRNFVTKWSPQLDTGIKVKENNKWIPKDVKKRIVKQLSQELVPKKVVDRLRKRMGG